MYSKKAMRRFANRPCQARPPQDSLSLPLHASSHIVVCPVTGYSATPGVENVLYTG
jgi:hypothetical protein